MIRSRINGLINRYNSLESHSKTVLHCYLILNLLLISLLTYFIYTLGLTGIFEQIASWAEELKINPLGKLYLYLLIILASCPPIIGYGTLITLAGFAFGVKQGFLIAAGSLISSSYRFYSNTVTNLHNGNQTNSWLCIRSSSIIHFR